MSDLGRDLLQIDGRNYGAYKDLRGRAYPVGAYTIRFEHIQGDLFAAGYIEADTIEPIRSVRIPVRKIFYRNHRDHQITPFTANSNAMYAIGNLFANGFGVGEDTREAKKWYCAAAKLDHPQAIEMLEDKVEEVCSEP